MRPVLAAAGWHAPAAHAQAELHTPHARSMPGQILPCSFEVSCCNEFFVEGVPRCIQNPAAEASPGSAQGCIRETPRGGGDDA